MPEVYRSISQNVTKSLGAAVSVFYALDLQQRPLCDFADAFRELPPTGMALVDGDGAAAWHKMPACTYATTPCHKQLEKLRTCFSLIQTSEAATGTPFDWLVRLRPDMQWHAPVGFLHTFDKQSVHLVLRRGSSYNDPHDNFALVPREFGKAYFQMECPSKDEIMFSGTKCVGNVTKHGKFVGVTSECFFKLGLARLQVPMHPFPPIYAFVREGKCRARDEKCKSGWPMGWITNVKGQAWD